MSAEELKNRKLKAFAESFSTGDSLSESLCCCGVTYYNSDWDCWTGSELQALRDDPKTVDVEHVSDLRFEGRVYVEACPCWHPRALMIIGFVDSHASELACYIETERENTVADLQEKLAASSRVKIENPGSVSIEQLPSVGGSSRRIDLS